MSDAILNGLNGLVSGFTNLHWSNPIMIAVGFLLLYLGIKKDFEPVLLVPIGFGAILVNIPLAGLMEEGGFLKIIYDAGILTEIFPLLIFVGHRCHDRFWPSSGESKDIPPRRGRTIWDFLNLGFSPGLGFYKTGSCLHRYHRRL